MQHYYLHQDYPNLNPNANTKDGVTGIYRSGFPSPAEDAITLKIDLNRVLIQHPEATFFVRVKGNSFADAGVEHNNLLIVDKSLPLRNGALAVCFLNGEFTLRIIHKTPKSYQLRTTKNQAEGIEIKEGEELQVWGIVSHIIKSL
jgi:DNA polymerase V